MRSTKRPGFNREPRGIERFAAWALVLLLAAAIEYARPFVSNQNQYFLYAVEFPQLERDWLLGTADPYPAFTWLAGALRAVSPSFGPVALAYVFNAVTLAAVYAIASALSSHRSGHDPRVPLLATLLIGASLIALPGELPLARTSLFAGLGEQYLVTKPSYLQPSTAGALLLFAFYLLLLRDENKAIAPATFGLAAVLTTAACVLHPTYIVSAAIGFGLIAVGRLALMRQNRFAHFTLFGVVLIALVVTANPAVLQIGVASPAYATALQRFAFERIPWHTLWWHWRASDLIRVGLVSLGAAAAWKACGNKLLGAWLFAGLALCVISALVLPLLPWPKLVLTFPWRLSVFLLPIAGTVVAVVIASMIVARWRITRGLIMAAAALIAASGIFATARNWNAMDSNSALTLLRAVRPSGTGVVPLKQQQIRLGVPVPIYVDHKSPPYASRDLIAWWARVDQVQALYQQPSRFCETSFDEPIGWILLPTDADVLQCPGRWTRTAANRDWTLYRSSP